jgi:acyl transferase domain-containing protein
MAHAPRECPERYRLAAQRILAGARDAAAVAAERPVEKPREMLVIGEDAKGMLAMLERCRSSEARLGMEYMQAVEAGNEVRASFLFSQWTKMGEQLRALEKTAPETLEKCGIFVRKDEIQRELEQLHRAILKSFRQQFRMCRARLRATKTAEEWNLVTDEIVDEGALMLVETEFREPLTLDAA